MVDFFQYVDYPEITTEEAKLLWVKVVNQMLKDSTYGLYKRCSRQTLNIDPVHWKPPAGYAAHARDAQLWFLDPTLDFEDICGYLDLDPWAVHDNAIRIFKYMNLHVPVKYKVLDLHGQVL